MQLEELRQSFGQLDAKYKELLAEKESRVNLKSKLTEQTSEVGKLRKEAKEAIDLAL